MKSRRSLLSFPLLVLAALAVAAFGPAEARAVTSCDSYASASGRDDASGAKATPYRTVQKLVSSLSPGQTGCLSPDTFVEDVSIRSGGAPGSPIVLASGPDGRATVRGRFYVADSANDVVVRELLLDGRNAADLPLSVSGDRVSFIDNEVTNANTTICFDIGSVIGYGAARNVLLDGNRIHNCGILPAQNHHHGIYMENSIDGIYRNNVIYDNADKGIVVFPDSDGNLIENNVIDGNSTGVHFGGSLLQDPWHSTYPKDNVVRRNIITGSRRYNVEAYWEWRPPPDTNNLVVDNCVWAAGFGIQIQDPLQASQWGSGFVATANKEVDPGFVDRRGKDFRLRQGSPCEGYGPASASASGGTPPPPPPPPAPPVTAPASTGGVRVSGVVREGETLTLDAGSWSGSRPISFAYEWRRCVAGGLRCSTIAGATGATYLLARADVGSRIRGVVTATNTAGSASAVSPATARVTRSRSLARARRR
jgi:parallel beta-helix repeat protein